MSALIVLRLARLFEAMSALCIELSRRRRRLTDPLRCSIRGAVRRSLNPVVLYLLHLRCCRLCLISISWFACFFFLWPGLSQNVLKLRATVEFQSKLCFVHKKVKQTAMRLHTQSVFQLVSVPTAKTVEICQAAHLKSTHIRTLQSKFHSKTTISI